MAGGYRFLICFYAVTTSGCGFLQFDPNAESGEVGSDSLQRGNQIGIAGSDRPTEVEATDLRERKRTDEQGDASPGRGSTDVVGDGLDGEGGNESESSETQEIDESIAEETVRPGDNFSLGPLNCADDCAGEYDGAIAHHGYESEQLAELADHSIDGEVYSTQGEVHSGDHALKIHFGDDKIGSVGVELPESLHSELYFRGWLYLPPGSITSQLSILEFHNSWGDDLSIRLRQDRSGFFSSREFSIEVSSMKNMLPIGQWICIQVSAAFSEVSGTSASLAVNETEVLSFENREDLEFGGFEEVLYGVPDVSSLQSARYLYWDDVVISSQAISCW
ncbi:MAG: hypothetical protein MK135_05210 [Polyangiaceae bacterium]|nr:hypothetical protein [Polyangiaceae bacterium]